MSITQVAERAGVSPATVSLVINNKASISTATANNVRQAMKEMGYVPAPQGRRRGRPMKQESTLRIAFVTSQPNPWLRSPVSSAVFHGVESAAREMNATLLYQCVPNMDEGTLRVLQGTIDGLVLLNDYSSENLKSLISRPCVQTMGHPNVPGWCDHVTYKGEAIGHLAAQRLLQNGHRHAGYISMGHDRHWTLRQHAFEEAMIAGGSTVHSVNAHAALRVSHNSQYLDQQMLSDLLDELLSQNPAPSCLFLSSDVLASPIYLLLLNRGIKPMKDIEIVSCNNARPLLSGLHPQPAVIDIHAEEIGRQAVLRLFWRIKNPDAHIMDLLVQPTLLIPSD